MFALYDKVLINKINIIGTIVDIYSTNEKTTFTVESDTKGYRSDGYGGVFPLFDCTENEISLIN